MSGPRKLRVGDVVDCGCYRVRCWHTVTAVFSKPERVQLDNSWWSVPTDLGPRKPVRRVPGRARTP